MMGAIINSAGHLYRTRTILLLALAIIALKPVAMAQTATDSLSGSWLLSLNRLGETNMIRMVLKFDGEKITGTAPDDAAITGTIKGEKIEFNVLDPNKQPFATLAGALKDGQMAGTITINKETYPWTAKKIPTRPPGAPRVHEFEAKEFSRYFSALIPPSLRIFPGDAVHTHTIDAGGRDKDSVQRSLGGNPLNGPIYVEGAVAGDTLAIHFTKIRLNRDTARSGGSITPTALDPGYFKNQKDVRGFDSLWTLDRENGIGRLANPTERLKNFKVELHPMLGCVGVAPARGQSILAGDLGNYGGNMDYNQVQEGTTVYLPVFQPGALLYLGDGHALQGDGELTGDALETSMEVEFTVDLIEGKTLGGPRAENAEYIMAIGIAGSLTDALQSATTVLARWIERDYGLNSSEVAMVLGTSIHYDIAEIVDPHVNVVAKVKKSVLAQLKP